MAEFTREEWGLIKQIVLGTLRVAIKMNDEQLIAQLGEILRKLQ